LYFGQATTSGARKKLKDGLSAKGYGDDLDLLESSTVGAGDSNDADTCASSSSAKYSTAGYLASSTAGAGATRSAGSSASTGTSSGGLLPSSRSAYEVVRKGSVGGTGGGGAGGTIVKAEFSDMFFRQDAPDGDANNLNLSKVLALNSCRVSLLF
jgi:hypothetical protein